jgi:LysR family transcriptional regulator, hydrogen peroxide-inducible genes activator
MAAISIKHLRYFDSLAQHAHFGRAAEACAISQPALSLQIKELEDILGTPLVERTARQMRLTPIGEAFAARGRDILRSVDELANLARASAGPLAGRLRIGVIPTVAPYLLPRVIHALTDRFPALDLRPREAVTQKLVDDLREGRLDVAIVALPVSEPSLTETPLFTEEFVLVRPRRMLPNLPRTPRPCAKCACFCWKKGIASAIRRSASARCRPVWRAR